MNTTTKKMMPVWCMGLVLFALRLVEKMIGFDGATGLAVPTPVRYALVGATVLGADNFAEGFAAEDRVVAGDILISTIKANM